MTTRKYNPGFLSDDEIVTSFCVRTSEFESIMEMLRDCRESSNPHQIVIGPRGSGKTSLLLRIAAEIRRDASLSSHFFPIVFAEESYEVSTAGEFWLECLSCLAVQAPGREGGPDLGRSYEELRGISDDRTLGERCLGAVLDFSDREAKRLVLFVENLNTLFRDMTDPDAGWRLRKVLQTEPRIILLASATRRFDQIDHPDEALYDLFRVTSLRPLGTDECATLWQTVSGREAGQETIRSLCILTGGNPRLVMIVARFGASLSFRALMSDLLDLVDDHTEYFRSHLEMLPAQERRVYLALADLWKPATAREIADRARLATSKCSAQLTRLSERAIVEVTGGTARRKQYYLTERMYNIYYLLRRPRGPHRMVESLIRFMESFYSPLELRDIGRSIARDAVHAHGDMRALHEIAFEKLLLLPALDQHRGALPATARQEIADIPDRMSLAPNELNEASITLDESVSVSINVSVDEGATEEAAGLELIERGTELRKKNRLQEALSVFDGVIDRYGESAPRHLPGLTTNALVRKGEVLHALGRPEDALATCDEVIRRYGDNEAPEISERVAAALLNKGAALGALSRMEAAIAACDEVVRRYGGSEEPDVLESVAKAVVNKAGLLLTMTRPQETIYVCDEAIGRFSERESPALVHVVAESCYVKGGAMLELMRPIEALAAFTEVLRRAPDAERSAIPELQAKAHLGRGLSFDRLGRFQEALAAYDEVAVRFGESENSRVRGPVASALARKVAVLDGQDRRTEAHAVHEELVRRLGQSAPAYHELVERSLVDRAVFELICGRNASAIETAGQALDRCLPDSVESRLRAHIIRAKASIADGNAGASEPDIADMLTVLANVETVPREHIRALMEFSVHLGPRRLRELVEASSSAALLLPFTTALAQEDGVQPRVAREVEEVATDIRNELKTVREGIGLRGTADGEASRVGNTARTSGIVIRDRLNRALPIRHGPVRLAVVGEGGRKTNSWKIWMEKNGETYFSIREGNAGFKVSLHKSGKQHIKMESEYWGQWREPNIYAGPMVATSAKLVFPTWGMREDHNLSAEEREAWKGNEIEMGAPAEGKLLAVAVVIRAEGQVLKQEGGRSETLARWRRPDGKEAHLIVREEAERNFKEAVLKAMANDDILRALRGAAESKADVLDGKTTLTAILAGPATEGGNFPLCVSATIGTREGVGGKEYVPMVAGLSSSLP